jgi:hypothetical protein
MPSDTRPNRNKEPKPQKITANSQFRIAAFPWLRGDARVSLTNQLSMPRPAHACYPTGMARAGRRGTQIPRIPRNLHSA